MQRMFIVSLLLLTTVFLSMETQGVESELRHEPVTDTSTLREKKCLKFKAPFSYVLVGDKKVLVLDTGATKSALNLFLYETVSALVKAEASSSQELIVVHSISHNGQNAAKSPLDGKTNVPAIESGHSAVTEFGSFNNRSNKEASLVWMFCSKRLM